MRETQLVAASDTICPTVFILGPPRSGTSLVYKVMCLHPATTFISNWVAKVPSRPETAVINRLVRRMPRMRQRSWFDQGGNAYIYGSRRSPAQWAFPRPVEGEPVYAACGIDEAGNSDNRAASIGRLRSRIARIHDASGSGTHFINKRVANNQRIDLLQEAFPDARFVAMVRDGRAVAYSLSRVDWWQDHRVWWYGGTPRLWEAAGGDPWELCARSWVHELEIMESGLERVDDDKKMLIRYEDLIADPTEMFARIAEFAGLPTSRDWDEQLASLSFPNRNAAWKDGLPAGIAESILAIQREQLQRYGYAT